ncbi:MAG: MBL fold metallo-hydrolase [Betaproteobacteria bacterium]|nr:MAG: MBL fold metallo-hydrolase [Betaproteobacteria bacterium]
MELPEVDRIRITSIVDNFVDNLLRDQGPALRRPRQARSYERCLCAEHGLAECVQSERRGETFPLLFDFGATPLVYLHNLKLLLDDYRLDLASIRTLVLSHGHWDHYGGLLAFLQEKRQALPREAHLYAGEDAFLARWSVSGKDGRRDMGALDEKAIADFEIGVVRVKEPRLLAGQALLSGEIQRKTSYEVSSPASRVLRDGQDIQDDLPGEQALVYHLRGKGLVVLTACGHAGVVNTVLHAREVTGVEKVHAIIGGFHLSGAPEERIRKTVEDVAALDPDFVVPMHCTGIETIDALSERLPRKVIYNSAGTRYELIAD